MSELALLWIGRRATGPWEELAAEYRRRIERFATLTEARIRPEEGRAADRGRVLHREGERLREYLRPGDTLIVLDERGRQLTSVELAGRLADRGRVSRVVLVVGSDLGLDPAIVSQADEVWALSRLTLPHLLARVLVLEQLYRALDMAAGGRYHRG